MSNAVATIKNAGLSALMDPVKFEQMQRVGRMLALSPLFPDHLRKGAEGTAIANGVLVMNMALRLNEDPLTVAQNIYFVSGKPGWSSSYMISKANQFGVFKDPIDWEITGQGDSLSVTAFGVMSSTGRRVAVTCDMALAKGEGWTKNAKYKTMPEQMLRYRSATFLIRLYCPEVMVGVPALVEIEGGQELKDITPIHAQETPPKDTLFEDEVVEALVEENTVDVGQSVETKTGQKPETEQKAQPDEQKFSGLYDMIVAEFGQCNGDFNGVLEVYGEQIKQLKASAPGLHAKLQEELKVYRNPDNQI